MRIYFEKETTLKTHKRVQRWKYNMRENLNLLFVSIHFGKLISTVETM